MNTGVETDNSPMLNIQRPQSLPDEQQIFQDFQFTEQDFPFDLPNWDLPQESRPEDPQPNAFHDLLIATQSPPELSTGSTSNSTSESVHRGCPCLASLYTTLATFQSLPPASFPYSMGALRNATSCGYEVVRCQRCPKVYNMAVQNSTLLITLLHLVIIEYRKLSNHIDQRAKTEEKIVYRLGEASTAFDQRHTGAPGCPMAVNIDLSGEEWRTLARKAVKQEVQGKTDDGPSLLHLIHEMRDRQVAWHERPRNAENNHESLDCVRVDKDQHEGPSHRTCAMMGLVERLTRMLDALGL